MTCLAQCAQRASFPLELPRGVLPSHQFLPVLRVSANDRNPFVHGPRAGRCASGGVDIIADPIVGPRVRVRRAISFPLRLSTPLPVLRRP
jgi:hypothetical protein